MRRLSFAVAAGVLATATGWGQLLVDPAAKLDTGWLEASGQLSYGKTKYDDGFHVDRAVMQAAAAYGIDPWVDVYVGAGFSNADLEGWPDNGNGFLIGAGARGIIFGHEVFCVMGYGELRYMDDNYGRVGVREGDRFVSAAIDSTLFETALGISARYWPERNFSVYGAVEVVPLSDGKVKMKVRSNLPDNVLDGMDLEFPDGKRSADLERTSFLGVRLGAAYDFGGTILRFESGFLHELTTSISVGFRF